jgi:hypothetical protein
MQGDRQFDHTKVGGQMTSDAGDGSDDLIPKLLAKFRKLRGLEPLEIGGAVDGL